MIGILAFELVVIVLLLLILFYALNQLYAAWLGAPYVPTAAATMDDMIVLAGDINGVSVLELGSGNGELSIRAAEKGAVALGVDVNPMLVLYSRWRAARRGVSSRVLFSRADFLKVPLPRKTKVVFVYLLPGLMNRLWPKLVQDLSPGTIVISHAFEFKGRSIDERRGKAIKYRIPEA